MAQQTEQDLRKEISKLKGFWQPRNTQFKEWYETLQMVDKLKETGLESFVSNDPRTAFNLALHLLTPQSIQHRIPSDPLQMQKLATAGEVERFLGECWYYVDEFNRRRGRGRWLRELVGYLLATGWYSVCAMLTETEAIAEVWNPMTVYPEYDDYIGLGACVHSYTITKRSLQMKAAKLGWNLPTNLTADAYVIDDYWFVDETGENVWNCVDLAANHFLKTPEQAGFTRIPIFVSPAGGLPDRGGIVTNDDWKKEVGQAMVATNAKVLDSYNKQMTFLMQLLRDTAQGVSWERNNGTPIVKDVKDLNRRGAHFRMNQGEDMGYVSKPGLPAELSVQLNNTGNMIQRGSLPYMLFGNIMGQVTGYLMSQVSSSAQQSLGPYIEAEQFCLTDIDNFWMQQLGEKGKKLKPYELQTPKMPEGGRVEVNIRVQIPGDVTQRATVARMLDPDFRISWVQVLDLLFPEIADPILEQSRVQAEMAMANPIASQINLIRAFKDQVILSKDQGDTETARSYQAAVELLTKQLEDMSRQQVSSGATNLRGVPTPRQEVMPRESMETGGSF
jgi:hypothetical protein